MSEVLQMCLQRLMHTLKDSLLEDKDFHRPKKIWVKPKIYDNDSKKTDWLQLRTSEDFLIVNKELRTLWNLWIFF